MVMIKKASGELQEYEPDKLYKSLIRVGATPEMAKEIVSIVSSKVQEGMTTKKIYFMALKKLKRMDIPTASLYKLKWAIMRLGQEGFSFEHYAGRLFEKKGYKVKLNQIIQGKCISHEVDIAAQKGDESLFIECKHKSKPGMAIDIQTALYVYARFLDMKDIFNRAMLLTNTKFSQQVITYSDCVGLSVMGWKYPPEQGLEKAIETYKIFPITVLHSLNRERVRKCLENKIVTLEELAACPIQNLAYILGVNEKKANAIANEARSILKRGEVQ